MNLLIITQKVDLNDSLLGFMTGWINEFAKHCDRLTVICLSRGQHDFPGKVKILSLGKEARRSKIKYLTNFYKYIWQERKNYDKVFVHMNPEYVVLGGLLWKFWRKNIALWYTHKNVDLKLRLAEKLVDIIFTASAKSFRLKSPKVRIVGHGIDISRFVPAVAVKSEKIILNVDRITRAKNQLKIIELFNDIKTEIPDSSLWLVGAPGQANDGPYDDEIRRYVKVNNLSASVKFLGDVANINLPAFYHQAKVYINLSATGSLDKTVLEAMACNLPVVTTNEAFKNIIPLNYCSDLKSAGEKAIEFLRQENRPDYRGIIIRDHSLKNLVAKIIKELA